MNQQEVENYNWGDFDFSKSDIQVLDTSLRDGLQDSQINHPTLSEKLEFCRRVSKIGIDAVDVAIPIAGGSHVRDAIRIARELPKNIDIVCLARTMEADVRSALSLSQGAGRKVEAIIFIGSSPIRRRVEGWEVDWMVRSMESSVRLAAKEGIIPNIATEHTTETEPLVIKRIFRAGLEMGGQKVCIADTTGTATHHCVVRLMRFFKEEILTGFGNIDIDWHGHNDRGMAVENALLALENGARRVHGTVLTIGERTGNTPLETLLINLKISKDPKRQNLESMLELSEYASKILNRPIPDNYPGIGKKAGETASGIHAAAMLKAKRLGLDPGSPYSVVSQEWFGRKASVRIGPLSGHASVEWVCEELSIPYTKELGDMALNVAQTTYRILTPQEIINIANSLKTNGNKNSYHDNTS